MTFTTWRGAAALLAAWVLALAWLFPATAAAADAPADAPRITERAWLGDPSGTLTLAQARGQRFTPYEGWLGRGYGKGAVWVRLKLEPGRAAAAPDELLALRLAPSYLDEVAVYDALWGEHPRMVGDRHTRDPDAMRAPAFILGIARGSQAREIYLRVQTSGTRLLRVDLLEWEQAHRVNIDQAKFSGIYIAVLGLFLLWTVFHWVAAPERVIGIFIAKQSLAISYAFLTLGLGMVFLPRSAWPALDIATNLSVVLTIAASLFFDYTLFKEYHPPRAARWGQLLVMALVLAHVPLLLAGETRLALRNANALVFASALVDMLAIFLARPPKGDDAPVVPRWVLGAIYSCLIAIAVRAMLEVFGVLAPSNNLLFYNTAHGAITGIGMVLLLQVRARRLVRRQAQVQLALALAQQQALQEREHREDQEKMLAMLAHEIKTLLATAMMRVGPGTAAEDRAMGQTLGEMNYILETAVAAGQVDSGLALARRPCRITDVLADVIGAHPAGERVRLQSGGGGLLETDEGLLRVVLRNLVDNALKYSPRGSPVEVSLVAQPRQGQRGVLVSVENEPGVAGLPDPERLFNKYYRSPHARRQVGCGLGLYLAASVARSLGGELGYAAVDGRARFELWLPAESDEILAESTEAQESRDF